MTFLSEEIASQPSCWASVAAYQLSDVAGLPVPGERVAVLGCGTSWFVAQSYAALREAAGQGETDAWPASEFPAGRHYDRVLALTRSGTTSEVLAALARVPASTPTAAVTADPTAPINDAVPAVITLEFADERSVVQTRFATSALVLLRGHLGESLDGLVEDGERALAAPLPMAVLDADQFTFLGTGWTLGLANEAALKLREAAQVWTESHLAMEYRHGPISVAAPGRVVWVLGEPPDGLLTDLVRTGAHVEHAPGDPMADLVRAQRLAESLAVARGLDPDRPRNLDRSVILG